MPVEWAKLFLSQSVWNIFLRVHARNADGMRITFMLLAKRNVFLLGVGRPSWPS
jgi:hypothetical protein